jgi:hypothetical protein
MPANTFVLKKTKVFYSQIELQMYQDYTALFGEDICIYKDSNANNKSYTTFGHTYQLPDGMQLGDPSTDKYLAGEKKFKVLEMEVYKII